MRLLRRRHQRVAQPDPPQRVRLQYEDGSQSDALPMVYLGLNESGFHEWEALAPPARGVHATHLRCGLLPPKTTLSICVLDEP